MARQTTKRSVDTPEKRADVIAEQIKNERGIDALRAEIDRLNGVIRHQELIIDGLQRGNEQISHELSEARKSDSN